MTSTLIHYISPPPFAASPPLHLTRPLALSTCLILSILLPPGCHSKFLPIALFLHFISLQSSFFIHSSLPFFLSAHYQRSPNGFLYLSQTPLIHCSPSFSTFLLCLSAFLFFSFRFFFITFFTCWNSKFKASEMGNKRDVSVIIVGATWAGIWESTYLLGFYPYHSHLFLQREWSGERKNIQWAAGVWRKVACWCRRSGEDGWTCVRRRGEETQRCKQELKLKDPMTSPRLKLRFTVATGREYVQHVPYICGQ